MTLPMGPEDEYFVYENRLASFQGPQPVTKRRVSTASSRAPKALTWPHKKSPANFAKAGFFFQPTKASPDNVVCFLCNKSLDGWEEDDDPLVEHLKHVPDCGWAIVAAVDAELGEYAQLHPLVPHMIAARKATFAGRWPYDGKKAWKCKTKQLADAGWYYNPTPESDDMVSCAYCQLGLDGWEAGDKPMDEHRKRTPDCAFFQMIDANPPPKKARATKGRASKASRLSVQSVATTMSDLQSMAGDLTLDPDMSVMTTTSVATTATKKGRPRKAAATKGRKTKAKKEEPVEILEDAGDAEMPPPPPPKPNRARKRGSEAIEDDMTAMDAERPAPKKPATKAARTTQAAEESLAMDVDDHEMDVEAPAPPPKQPAASKKGRTSTAKTTTRKASQTLKPKASTASLRAQAAADDELEQQLQADLARPLTEDEYMTADSESERQKAAPAMKRTAGKKAASQKSVSRSQQEQEDYAMFDPAPVQHDDAQVDDELRALEADMIVEKEAELLEVPKKGKKAGTRKVSKQTKKAKEPEAPAPPPEPVEEPEEESVVVTRVSVLAPEPEILEDPDTTSETVVNRTSIASTSQPKRGRGRPKKSSTNSLAAATEAQPQAADTTIQATQVSAQPEPEATKAEESIPAVPSPVQAPPVSPQPKSTRNINKSLPPPPPSPPPQSEKPAPILAPGTPRTHQPIPPTASAKQATISPSPSPQSSDAENHPPSSQPPPTAATKRVVLLPPTTPTRTALSPLRRNGALKTTTPWEPVDLDLVFGLAGSPAKDAATAANEVRRMLERPGRELSAKEKEMTVEEWISYNVSLAEQMLAQECEGMVSTFEKKGMRAMETLEGLVVE